MTRSAPAAAAKTERLLNLTIALLATRRPLRKSQIRDAVPQYAECANDSAFDRMFERDKDELRTIGVPLVTVQLDNWSEIEDAYRIDADAYALPDVDLTPAELAVLGLAARMWDQVTVGAASSRALVKLQALGIDADGEAVSGIEPRVSAPEPGFEPLYQATRQRYPVSFGYRASGELPVATRTVEPWTLALRRGVWYLACHDRDRGAPRLFRLSRMVGPWKQVGRPGSVALPEPAAVAECLKSLDVPRREPEREEDVALLWLRGGTAPRLRLRATQPGQSQGEDRPTASAGRQPPDGFDAVEVAFADVETMASQVASSGPDAVVVSPKALRDAVQRRWHTATMIHERPAQREPAISLPPPVSVRPPAPTAVDRLSRLLAMVPYLLERPGIPIGEAAAHFGVTDDELVDDLQLLFVCGTPGHLPDDLIEADWSGGVVTVGNADAIARPLRLSADEAIALLVGLAILAEIPGPHDKSAVTGAQLAIAAVLARHGGSPAADIAAGGDPPNGHGEGSGGPGVVVPVTFVGVDTGAGAAVTDAVVAGLRQRRRLHLRYLSAARDELSERTVDPLRLHHTGGWDYLEAWCHRAQAVRMFRLDRVIDAVVLSQAATTQPASTPPARSPDRVGGEDDQQVTLRLSPRAVWVADYFRATRRVPQGDDGLVAVVSVGHPDRLVRMALGSDGGIEIVSPEPVRAAVAQRAARALAGHDVPVGSLASPPATD